MFLKILQKAQENTCTRGSFLIKFQTCNFIKKRDFGTGVFLWILRNFKEHLYFYGAPPATASGLRFISEGSSYPESKNLAEDLEHEV